MTGESQTHPEGDPEAAEPAEAAATPPPRRPDAWRGRGAVSLGALALGAVAVGALAVGSLAIGRLAIGRARVRVLRVDRLILGRIERL